MAKILTGLLMALACASPSYANALNFVIAAPTNVTLIVGLPTEIAAAIINTTDTPLVFGCATTACGGVQPFFEITPTAETAGQFSYFEGGPLRSFTPAFRNLVLQPGARFDFTLTTISLKQATSAPLPLLFNFNLWQTSHLGGVQWITTVDDGPVTAISELTVGVPDQGSLLSVIGVLCLLLRRHGATKV
jgi:hypothetical protein